RSLTWGLWIAVSADGLLAKTD
ncbi:MAG: hypothetical protein RIQ68_833, partial [Pseudomonadota bacterium]